MYFSDYLEWCLLHCDVKQEFGQSLSKVLYFKMSSWFILKNSLPFGALGLPNWAVQMEDEAEKKCLGGDPGSISW